MCIQLKQCTLIYWKQTQNEARVKNVKDKM